MIKKRVLFALVGLVGTSATAVADVEPDFSFVDVGFTKMNIDDTDFSPSGFTVGTSVVFTDMLFGVAKFTSTSDDIANNDVDLTQATIGLGARYTLSNSTAAYAVLGYENAEIKVSGFSEEFDEDGYSLAVGLRSNLSEAFELDGTIGYMKLGDESDTEFKVTANYYFMSTFAVNASYSMVDDIDSFTVGARYSF
ncbi:porin family protein [Alteromonas ponticola]|uniref:Porin family protein n=1 Tax=Alteromonas aquimaris TaxID=2998417 RepID=A0ABT3P9Q6_9ALTE|nr:outer membrane beta-barrel protein [Alteromonas aquimaris]MCW8109445.1 porin family protein [Alteromonas aquimaris]